MFNNFIIQKFFLIVNQKQDRLKKVGFKIRKLARAGPRIQAYENQKMITKPTADGLFVIVS